MNGADPLLFSSSILLPPPAHIPAACRNPAGPNPRIVFSRSGFWFPRPGPHWVSQPDLFVLDLQVLYGSKLKQGWYDLLVGAEQSRVGAAGRGPLPAVVCCRPLSVAGNGPHPVGSCCCPFLAWFQDGNTGQIGTPRNEQSSAGPSSVHKATESRAGAGSVAWALVGRSVPVRGCIFLSRFQDGKSVQLASHWENHPSTRLVKPLLSNSVAIQVQVFLHHFVDSCGFFWLGRTVWLGSGFGLSRLPL